MHYAILGESQLKVSKICLGTMTWGEQNSEAEAHAQLDYAIDAGINFIDTAELYPVPPRAETQGLTEQYLGSWLKKKADRDKLIIATKVCAAADWIPYLRGGKNRADKKIIKSALDASLKRLQTDYIDLYQIHWPERHTNYFGQLGYYHMPEKDGVPIGETLDALAGFIQLGKIRYIGISNETPWGMAEYLRIAKASGLPRIVSIQNPYNLLNRTFEIGLAEFAHREHAGLLAYSPLGFGALSGKYQDGARPEGARLTLFSRFERYTNEQGEKAIRAYVELAGKHGLVPAQMALAYVNSRPFLTSTIIGATTMEQLQSNIASIYIQLEKELLEKIEAIHVMYPNPNP
ncbi:MAG: aldo/keto reductase [Gammaproteobacteria bacterium RBG_16_51_14]|nr:MAG: aldo/keto reductase [Gammaproteobacteria bacterium RBG_16_51_14]